MDAIKVLLGEKAGTELDRVEYELHAETLPFSHPDYVAQNARDAIVESKSKAIAILRFTIQLTQNGNVSDGEFIGLNSLMSDKKIVFPDNVVLTDLSWQNGRTDVSFDLKIYKNGLLESNLCETLQIRNNADGWGIFRDCAKNFNSGDWIQIKYVDQGTNCSDLCLILWGRRREEGE